MGIFDYSRVCKELQVILQGFSISPGKRIKPLENDKQFGQHDVYAVALLYVDFFVRKDLFVGFIVVQSRVDKNVPSKRTGRAVAAGLHDPEPAVPDDGAMTDAHEQGHKLKNQVYAKDDYAAEIEIKKTLKKAGETESIMLRNRRSRCNVGSCKGFGAGRGVLVGEVRGDGVTRGVKGDGPAERGRGSRCVERRGWRSRCVE